uniref:RNA helicase n=1 Tax=Steinernema glaseri TaxID=37863 RepID=A0A1I7YTY1_9BILA
MGGWVRRNRRRTRASDFCDFSTYRPLFSEHQRNQIFEKYERESRQIDYDFYLSFQLSANLATNMNLDKQYRPIVARTDTDFNECAEMTVGNGIYTARMTGPTGKGNGLIGNAHLSKENRIGTGDNFETLRSTDNITIDGGAGSFRLIDNFDDCDIDKQVIINLKKLGIDKPTAVQRGVIPIAIEEFQRDIVVQAETGSGKTAAYLIPIICNINTFKQSGLTAPANSPYSVIVTPTRELAAQVAHEARMICKRMNISVALSYGQMPMGICRQNIRRDGCDILVATPGRLIGHFEERSIHFTNVKWVVLDEADQMFDYSLGQFVVPFLKEVKRNSFIRIFAFSATFTAAVMRTMNCYLEPEHFIITGRAAPKDNIKQTFIKVLPRKKRQLLVEVMNHIIQKNNKKSTADRWRIPKTIVFVDTKFETNYLAIYLTNLGIPCISFNGDRTQKMREKAIDDFSRGICSVMICTNVCARGLNMKDVRYVINYDIPFKCQEMFMHRIGRTGRAGNKGIAYTFFELGRDEENVEELISMIEGCGLPIPEFIQKIAQERVRPMGFFHHGK